MDTGKTRTIAARIARDLTTTGPVDAMIHRLPASDLQSLLMHVMRERSAMRSPVDLVRQYEQTNIFGLSSVDVRSLLLVEATALECATGFEPVELSPVAPLGVNTVLGQIDQNNCLATIRGAEVLADPTTLQALEVARRRRAGATGTIRLCSRSRQLRLQPTDVPWFTPHFGIFSLVTAGRDTGSRAFEAEQITDHVAVLLRLLTRLNSRGFQVRDIDVAISDTKANETLLATVRETTLVQLAAAFPDVQFRIDPDRTQGINYYDGLCLRIDAVDTAGTHLNLADGGGTNWTQRLLSNAKERMIVSGIGTELIAKRFASS